jgi:methyl-accepting chemotaxis protein
MSNSFESLNEAIVILKNIFGELNTFSDAVNRVGELAEEDLKINTMLQDEAKNFSVRSEEIINTVKEQKNGINVIMKTVNMISETAQSTTYSCENLSLSVEQLIGQSKELQKDISSYFFISGYYDNSRTPSTVLPLLSAS